MKPTFSSCDNRQVEQLRLALKHQRHEILKAQRKDMANDAEQIRLLERELKRRTEQQP